MVSTYKPIEKPLTWWQKNGHIVLIIIFVIWISLLFVDEERPRKFVMPFLFFIFLISSKKRTKNHGTYFLEIGISQLRWKLPEMAEIEWRDFTEIKRIVLKPKEIVFFRDSSFMDFIPLPQFAELDQAALREEISAKAREYNIELILR